MNTKTSLIEAHIVRLNKGKVEFLLMKRSPNEKYPNIWQMVTGKIKANEKAYETAAREINEETNIDVNEIFVVPKINSFYNEADDEIILIPIFVVLIKKNIEIKLSSEHSEYKWVDRKEANKLLAWPGQKDSVKIIKSFFDGKYKSLNFIKINLDGKAKS